MKWDFQYFPLYLRLNVISDVNYDCKEILKLSFNNNYTNSTDAWVENMDSRWQDYLVWFSPDWFILKTISLGGSCDGSLGIFRFYRKMLDDICDQV